MPYLDISIIKSSCLTVQEKEQYAWYFDELCRGYYTAAPGSQQEIVACQWSQELAAHFWADVERTMRAARHRLTDNLSQMMANQCNFDSEEREEERRRMREIHERLDRGFEASGNSSARGKYSESALTASHWLL